MVLTAGEIRARESALGPALADGSLMARASFGIAAHCLAALRDRRGRVAGSRIVVLAGAGDNGGDALFAGAYLAGRGAQVHAVLTEDRSRGEALAALLAAGGSTAPRGAQDWSEVDLVLDGILGIGGRGGLRGPAARIAAALNRETQHVSRESPRPPYVVAVDLPSGIDADTGAAAGGAIHADLTVTPGAYKPGLLLEPGRSFAGRTAVVDIGLDLLPPASNPIVLVDDEFAAHARLHPGRDDDKYRRGVVGVCAGSARYPGAAILAAGAARLGNAGFVRYIGTPHDVVTAWPDVVPDAALVAEAGRVQAWVIGPGLGTDEHAADQVRAALASDVPVVIDADGLTLIAMQRQLKVLVQQRSSATILTPHAGEFARLVGSDAGSDTISAVRGLAAELGAVVLHKGSCTIVADPGGDVHLVTSGVPQLGTAGSGDVLSGLLGGLLAGWTALGDVEAGLAAQVAAAAAHLHGCAAARLVAAGLHVTAPALIDELARR